MTEDKVLVVVVTGLSGAGKSTAVHALEDLGFFCVDNLPSPVVSATLEAIEKAGIRRVALGIDVRVRSYLEEATSVLDVLTTDARYDVRVLFLDAADELLLRRYSTTRRPHPLNSAVVDSGTTAPAVLDGIRLERDLLVALRSRASAIVDSTGLSVHELRRQVVAMFGPGTGDEARMSSRIVSFGFKYGPPSDADLVFDVRFLRNPYFEEALRPLSGLDQPVRDYVLSSPEAQALVERILPLLEFCLPRFEREGKSYLTVAIGCTGGRHRSVALAEHLAAELSRRQPLRVTAAHRDVRRADAPQRPAAPQRAGAGADHDHPSRT